MVNNSSVAVNDFNRAVNRQESVVSTFRNKWSVLLEYAPCGKSIAPQRMNEVSQARQFKTLSAAYSYLRTYLEYRGDVSIRLLEHTTETDDDPPTEQALFV
jgi:hypothetical protein